MHVDDVITPAFGKGHPIFPVTGGGTIIQALNDIDNGLVDFYCYAQ